MMPVHDSSLQVWQQFRHHIVASVWGMSDFKALAVYHLYTCLLNVQTFECGAFYLQITLVCYVYPYLYQKLCFQSSSLSCASHVISLLIFVSNITSGVLELTVSRLDLGIQVWITYVCAA